jgi:quercetin dioxygenase-like cupin family protein
MNMKAAIMCFIVVTGLAGGTVALAREPQSQGGITAETLLAEALAGDASKEVNAQIYIFPPGDSTPWHIHPDAHEVAYVLEGTLTFQRADGQPIELKAGEVDYLGPNIVHRGMNQGGKPVKLFVVRIKPKDKPLAEDMPAPR